MRVVVDETSEVGADAATAPCARVTAVSAEVELDVLTAPWAIVAVAADVTLLEDEAEIESGAPNAANETEDEVELLTDELGALTAA